MRIPNFSIFDSEKINNLLDANKKSPIKILCISAIACSTDLNKSVSHTLYMRIRVYISCKFDQYNCCCSIDTTYQALKFTFLSAAARWISRIAINTFREWFRSFSNECQLPAQCLNRAFKMPTRNIKSKFAAKWYESIANKLPIINKLLWLIPASTKQSSLFSLPTLAGFGVYVWYIF